MTDDEIERLREERDSLLKALQPFADAGKCPGGSYFLSDRHLTAARKAVNAAKKGISKAYRPDPQPSIKKVGEILAKIRSLAEEVESLRDEEQEFFDNLPENIRGSEKGWAIESAIEALESVMTDLESAADNCMDAQNI